LNVVLLNEEDKKNYSLFNTPDKPSTQYWKDRNEYIGGGGCDGKCTRISERPRNYCTSHVKGRIRGRAKLH
jgi:hypothetical protein